MEHYLPFIVVGLVVLVAAFTDLRLRKVHNVLTLPLVISVPLRLCASALKVGPDEPPSSPRLQWPVSRGHPTRQEQRLLHRQVVLIRKVRPLLAPHDPRHIRRIRHIPGKSGQADLLRPLLVLPTRAVQRQPYARRIQRLNVNRPRRAAARRTRRYQGSTGQQQYAE